MATADTEAEVVRTAEVIPLVGAALALLAKGGKPRSGTIGRLARLVLILSAERDRLADERDRLAREVAGLRAVAWGSTRVAEEEPAPAPAPVARPSRRVPAYPLTGPQAEALDLLRANPGRTAEDLAALVGLSRAAMVDRLGALEGRGLAARRLAGRDRRERKATWHPEEGS